tara:strand:- start:101 stop:220 length:120 start_codon:yes stop_codon:yes gene_type:complete
MVAQAMGEADQEGNGFLSFEEFTRVVGNSELKAKMTINF